MKKRDTLILIGSILIAVGLFIFFKDARLYSFRFYRFGSVSTGGILIALLLLDVILLVATRHKAFKILLPVLLGFIVLSVILGSHIVFSDNVLNLLLALIPAAVGAGLLLRAFLPNKGSKV